MLPTAVLSTLLSALAPQGADVPAFVAGDPRELAVSVRAVDAVAKDVPSSIVTVTVKNHGQHHAEPLAFHVAPKPKKDGPAPLDVLRVDLPHYGRAGRALAPGASASYPLLVPLDAQALRGAKVAVTTASFADGALALDEPVRAGRPRSERAVDPRLGRTATRTYVEFENRCGYPIDAVFRAEFVEPRKAETLVEVHLGPNEVREVLFTEMPTTRGSGWSEAEIKRLTLVDWSAIVTRGEEQARELFAEVYAGWHRLPDDAPGVRGRFAYTVAEGDELTEVTGRFQATRAGDVTLRMEAGDPAVHMPVTLTIQRALRDCLRPGFDEALADARLELVRLGDDARATVLRLDPAELFNFRAGARYIGVRDGRIAWTSSGLAPEQREEWTTRPFGEGWVATDLRQYTTFQATPQSTARTQYDASGLPAAFVETWRLESYLDSATTTQLHLADVVLGAPDGDAAPPTGPLADALRAAWDATYRYPDETVTLSGEFQVETPGTDGVWQGLRRVSGTFRLEGFRGSRWKRGNVEIDLRDLDERDQAYLADAVLDRFLLFHGRDFASRGAFDATFAGAVLSEAGGELRASGAAWAALGVVNGAPARIRLASGLERELTFKTVAKQLVPTEIRTGEETVRATWTDLGDGWLYPKELVFERVFGPDWGPETLRLSKLRIAPEGR